jgi:hypothetical protein
MLFCDMFEAARRVRGRGEEMLVARESGSGEVERESGVGGDERSKHRSIVLAILFGPKG